MDVNILPSYQISEANCTFSVRLAADVDINQNPVKFETVDLNICDAYDPATGERLSFNLLEITLLCVLSLYSPCQANILC